MPGAVWSAYVLLEPGTDTVRYVGITSQPVEKRLIGHFRYEKTNPHKSNWVSKLRREGLVPDIRVVLRGMTQEEACQHECWLIEDFKNFGCDILNVSLGGVGIRSPGWRHTDEARARMSAARKGIPKSPEWKARISAAKTGVKRPNMSGPNNPFYGKQIWPSELISAFAKTRVGPLNPHFGKKHTAEARAKISAARREREAQRRANA